MEFVGRLCWIGVCWLIGFYWFWWVFCVMVGGNGDVIVCCYWFGWFVGDCVGMVFVVVCFKVKGCGICGCYVGVGRSDLVYCDV